MTEQRWRMCWPLLPLLVEQGYISFTFNLTVTSSASELVDSATWCNREAEDWFNDRPQGMDASWRESEERGQEVRRCTASTRNHLLCVYLAQTPSLADIHRLTRCPRCQSSVQFTHKLCSHPQPPPIQCSNSTLLCNTVTQSHQLFIKDSCTCSVMGLIDREMEFKGEEVKIDIFWK